MQNRFGKILLQCTKSDLFDILNPTNLKNLNKKVKRILISKFPGWCRFSTSFQHNNFGVEHSIDGPLLQFQRQKNRWVLQIARPLNFGRLSYPNAFDESCWKKIKAGPRNLKREGGPSDVSNTKRLGEL